MTSLDVVAPALLLPIPVLSLVLSLFNSLFHSSTPSKRAIFLLLAILAAVAAGSALSVACGEPLRIVARVFTVLLHTTCEPDCSPCPPTRINGLCPVSGITIHALSPSSLTPAFPPPFLRFFLSLVALLVACGTSFHPPAFPFGDVLSELVSALIPTSPPLLPASFALVSRGILLTLALVTAVLLRHRRAAIVAESNIEKGRSADDSSGRTPCRVSSPTQATWPFPGSLAFHQTQRGACSPNKSPLPDLLPPSAATCTRHVSEDACKIDGQNFILLPLVLVTAQIFAALAAAVSVAACMLVDAATDQPPPHILLVGATCTLLWSFSVLAVVQSESDSLHTILSSHSCHADKYSPLILARIPRRSRLR